MNVIDEVLVLFVIMAVGFSARRFGLIGGSLNKGLADLLLHVTMPLMILGAFNIVIDASLWGMSAQIFIFSGLLHAGMFFLSQWIFKGYEPDQQKVMRFSVVFSNCAFMGYPILQSVYGKEGVFLGSIFLVPFIISLWTAGVLIFNKNPHDQVGWSKVMLNPGILAVFLGMVLFVLKLKLPEPLSRGCDLLGSTTTPLAMVLIGSTLAEVHVKHMFNDINVYYVSALRLIVIPVLAGSVLWLCGVRGIALGASVICACMPVAANTAAFAERFGSSTSLASRCVFISTLLSIITVPVFVAWAGHLIPH